MYTKIVPIGDCALQVEFENEISIKVNSEVVQLRMFLENLDVPGVTELVQVYRTLMIHYKPEIITYDALRAKVEDILKRFEKEGTQEVAQDRLVTEIPVLYGDEWGPDIDEVAEKEGISVDEVIKKHSTNLNYVYFVGFSPGLVYVGNPEDTFSVQRRTNPRVGLPRGSVTIWKNQTTVFPIVQPGGWNVIGRTPIKIYDPTNDNPFLLHGGQWIKFVPISKEEYLKIEQEVENGTYVVKSYQKED